MQNSAEQSYWQIIKSVIKKCYDTETSTQAGRINLTFGLIYMGTFIGINAVSWFDKALSAIFSSYKPGLPWYATFILLLGGLIYFWYCTSKLMEIEKIKNE